MTKKILKKETQKSVQDVIGDVSCPGRYCSREKCVYVQTWKKNNENYYDRLQCRACCQVLNIPFEDQQPTIMLFGGDAHIALSKRRVVSTEMKNHLLLWKNCSATHNQPHLSLCQKSENLFQFWHNPVGSPLVVTVT